MRARGRLLVLAAAAALAVPAIALAGIDGPTELISIGPAGQDPVTDRGPASVSSDGRYVAFCSAGRDLDPADGNAFDDVFVRDRQTGSLQRVSLSDSGGDGNGASTTTTGSLSGDGQRVAFASTATNLVASDNNLRRDVFVRDRAASTTTLLSRNFMGLDANGSASEPAISADGSAVAFVSDATDMTALPDLDGKADVYVRDLGSGTTTRVSETADGLPANGPSSSPALSADGSKVVFASSASDLVAGDTNGRSDVFLHDLASGETTRVSVSSSEEQATGEAIEPFVSADGRHVGFSSNANNLGGVKYTSSGNYDVYLRDTQNGTTDRLTMRIVPYEGENYSLELSAGTNRRGAISPDGRLVAFESTSSQYVPNDGSNGDVFVIDRATDQVTVLTRTPTGTTPNGSSFVADASSGGVAFSSNATNLTTPGGAFNNQVFFRPFSADAVSGDIDGDGVANLDDVCPLDADPAQTDTDGEGRGDACDGDDDSDTIADPFEPAQQSDPQKRDTDGDGVDDLADDYPNDGTQAVGTDHQRLTVARLESSEGEAALKLLWDASAQRFEARVTGALQPRVSYTVAAYRRHPAIRNQTLCQATTNDVGALACARGGLRTTYFTHVELRRGSTVLATAVCDDAPIVGERRCDVPE